MKTYKQAFIAVSLLAASISQASYITQFGDDISFTYKTSTLFGTGTVVGNSISFSPDSFLAHSADGAGYNTPDLTLKTLNITIESVTPGYNLQQFHLFETGDYKLIEGTSAYANAEARLQVSSQTTNCSLFGVCNTASTFRAGTLADTDGAIKEWSLDGSIDLADIPDWGSDSKVIVQIQNNLEAYTENTGELATIQKKLGGVGLSVNPIPVPAAVWLFGTGLLGLAAMARKQRNI